MKSTKLLNFAMAVLLLVSCSKGDEDVDYAKSVSGSYTGSLIMSVMGSSDTTECTMVEVSRESVNRVSVTLPAYGEGRMSLPSMVVGGVTVAQSGGSYLLSKGEYGLTHDSTYYSGNLSGIVYGGKLKLDYTCRPGAMPMAINFSFVQD